MSTCATAGMKEPMTGLAALEEVSPAAAANGRVAARCAHHEHGIEGNTRTIAMLKGRGGMGST